MKQAIIDRIWEERREIMPKYQQVFGSKEGQDVLRDMEFQFRADRPSFIPPNATLTDEGASVDPKVAIWYEGARAVLCWIKDNINFNNLPETKR